MGTDKIGTGQTYTTIAAWESAKNTGTFTEDVIGECLAEEFSIASIILLSGGTPSTFRLILRSEDGAEHDGRSHDVSGIGNARIVGSTFDIIRINQPQCTVQWLEIEQTGTNRGIGGEAGNHDDTIIDHNVMWSSNVSNSNQCIGFNATDNCKIYRNISYGFGGNFVNIQESGSSGNNIFLNTNYIHGASNHFTDGSGLNENNAAFDMTGDDIAGATRDNNASSDASGDSGAGLTNLTPSNEVVNPTTTLSSTDLRIKDTNATIYQAADTTYSTSTYPDIDQSITQRGVSISGTWSVGADQEPEGAGVTVFEDHEIARGVRRGIARGVA